MVNVPGKILLLGGYAVLEGYRGLSVAVVDEKGKGMEVRGKEGKKRIISKEFGIERTIGEKLIEEFEKSSKEERMAVAAYVTALAYFKSKGIESKKIEIEIKTNKIFGKKGEKSGLGSSATVVSGVVAELFLQNGFELERNMDKVHKIAQIAHALAGGNVGSGFDIATAVYGTIEYERYPKETIEIDMKSKEKFVESVGEVVEKEWKGMRIKKADIGEYGLEIYNIKGAKTSTVSAVGAVKKLREKNRGKYDELLRKQAGGEEIIFLGLEKNDDEKIRKGMRIAREAQREIGEEIKKLGEINFTPIEPDELKELINSVEGLENVVAGRCPGAGGYDSVVFITTGKVEGIEKIGKEFGLELENLGVKVSKKGLI
ncbi:hypothetical protein KAW38_00150 [Candidatus Micrarchaeota archaeon]|nr:hypothetical protein [Candidatus Micrarchaeota archaeon]